MGRTHLPVSMVLPSDVVLVLCSSHLCLLESPTDTRSAEASFPRVLYGKTMDTFVLSPWEEYFVGSIIGFT